MGVGLGHVGGLALLHGLSWSGRRVSECASVWRCDRGTGFRGETNGTARDQLECEGGGHGRHGVRWRFVVRGLGVVDGSGGGHNDVVEGSEVRGQ